MKIIKKIIHKSLAYFGYEIKRIYKNIPQQDIEPRPHKSERDANGYNIVWNSKDFIDQYTFNHLSLYNDIIEFLKDYKILDKSESIADVGCGPGNVIGLISQKYPGKLYYGFDFSKSAIQAAKLKYNKIHFQIHDIYEPLDECFDTVICTETLEHLLYPSKALNTLLNATIQACVLTVPDGRLDNYQGHINFWSEESFECFLKNHSEYWDIRVQRIGSYIGALMFRH